ncbi:hypothetical protein HBH56_231060 [Parastagonospora nodorum]|uniref:Uncharacterized protein n=1 Tax=Phaeosphaeria nodorum (strain SN15 / ATCC MYA-4574 / FGSC 10173) TaxID=321614 RepID=A0A7U2F667_PHANO|nr:hypothetical protein HBH56_231060 [Parastagonospora nodorum]QRC99458.1 hypothetical protein JI435_143690 [Parastagonospora nodorum SN15]KAH3924535.1 hypothetical protein HBH54_194100 [Parastagonospora nodorum]KAH3958409.1 hypothetical protein HBH51_210780 [Parastagonospora nodorum]KAH3993631.1 hypothetical protein HBI10_199450 [Parastagonospora nodorum]
MIMKIYLALVACGSIVAAIPAPQNYGNGHEAMSWSSPLVDAGASCQPGYDYCYGQIIGDLRIDPQIILRQYCDVQFEHDALSCHACKKWPWPLDTCGSGPGAWKSVFTCVSGDKYTFKERCDTCEAGKCLGN